MKFTLPPFQAAIQRARTFNPMVITILLVIILFLIIGTAGLTNPPGNSSYAFAALNSDPTMTPADTSPAQSLTPTPLPRELVENQDQTLGLALAATLLVLIVTVAVFRALLPARP